MDITTDSDRCVHLQEVRLCPEDLSASGKDEKSLLLGETTLAVEVLLEEGKVGFCRIIGIVELVIAGLVKCRRLYIWMDWGREELAVWRYGVDGIWDDEGLGLRDGREPQKECEYGDSNNHHMIWHDCELRSMSCITNICQAKKNNRYIKVTQQTPVMGLPYKTSSTNIPLQTRSSVDTWDPSSMVCSVKSISGGGFFSFTARIAFSSFWLLSKTIPPALGSAIVMLDWGWLFSSRNTKRERKEGRGIL